MLYSIKLCEVLFSHFFFSHKTNLVNFMPVDFENNYDQLSLRNASCKYKDAYTQNL